MQVGELNGYRREWLPTIQFDHEFEVNEPVVNSGKRHEDELVELPSTENRMHEVHEKATSKQQHAITSKYPAIAEKPKQIRHFNFPKRHFGLSKIIVMQEFWLYCICDYMQVYFHLFTTRNALICNLKTHNFQNFPGGMPPDPLDIACIVC